MRTEDPIINRIVFNISKDDYEYFDKRTLKLLKEYAIFFPISRTELKMILKKC